MASVIIVDELGEPTRRDIISREFRVVTEDGEDFDPAVTERVEYDHRGQTSSVTTVCGETENRRESDQQPDITAEGVVTQDQLEPLKGLKRGEQITVISDIHSGQVLVKRVTIEQSSDIVSYIPDGSDEEELAFSFQLQLGQPGDEL
jgi:hypothetical protein